MVRFQVGFGFGFDCGAVFDFILFFFVQQFVAHQVHKQKINKNNKQEYDCLKTILRSTLLNVKRNAISSAGGVRIVQKYLHSHHFCLALAVSSPLGCA